jgi:hypothetical protein
MQWSKRALSTIADAMGHLLDGGSLCIYAGPPPYSPDDDPGEAVLLAELHFGTPAFERAVAGQAEATEIEQDDGARNGGEPVWYRCMTAAGEAVLDGEVGEGGLELDEATIKRGARVSVNGFTLRVG